MKCNVVKRIGMAVFAITIFAYMGTSQADAGTLLDEMQVQDTCGTTYADKLASCTPFKCQKPSPMAMMFGFPTEKELQKMPPERQKKMRATMVAAEKKMQSMSPAKRAEMKAKMVSKLEIKGYNAQHQCQIETGVSPQYVMRCTYDAPMLKRVSDYERIIAKADHVESDSSGSTVNGKWVTKSVTKVDGKVIDNPLIEAMNKKTCKSFKKDADQGLIDIDQMNHMSHFEFKLSEHGKQVDGHVQILNSANGKVLFDKGVNTSKNMRKINLKPGTFDIKVTSKNPQLAPIWFRKIKLGEANVFKKDVEFYAISGTLKLTVKVDGKPTNMAIYITDPETHEWLYPKATLFGKKPKFYFKSSSIKLPENLTGKYKVFVTPVKSGFEPKKDAKYKHFTLNIHNGEKLEKTIDFGGTSVANTQTNKIAAGKSPSHLVPLRLFWSAQNQDNFVTATKKGADEALAAGYRFARIEACIIAADTKLADRNHENRALKLFWSRSRGDHFSAASSLGEQDALNAGYQFIRTEGYILPFKQSGTIPLKLYWSSGRKDNFSTASQQGVHAAEAAGYQYARIQGYVYPPSKCQNKFSTPLEDKVDVAAGKLNKSSIFSNTEHSAKPSVSASPANAMPQQTEKTEKNTNTLFILDASGSMWGQINGTPKITIAKEVMEKLVPELPNNARIGLIAYGHRRKGDCNDVEMLVKLGAGNQQAVLKAVKGLNAKGKTPLTRSVNRAFKMLQTEKQASTIILVSDGIESCNANPCATVKAAKKYGVKFILHTVGFGLSKKESAQLQCMAKAGGGEYFQANNAEQLLKSARKAVKFKGPGKFKLTLRSNGKPVNAWVRLAGNGSIGLVDLTNDAGVKPDHVWHLKPGIYRLETYPAGLHGVSPMVIDGIKIDSGKTVTKVLDFNQSTLHLTATNNDKPAIVQINVKNLASGKTVFDTSTYSTFTMRGVKTPYDVKVMPGRYRLTVKLPTKSDLEPYIEEIDLTSNSKPLEKTVNFKTDILRITALKNGKPVKAHIYVDDLAANRNIFNSDFLVSYGFQTPYEVTLLPGKYRLTVKLKDITPPHTEALDINAGGKVVEKIIHFEDKPVIADSKDMEQDTDRPGNDYQRLVPASNDPALCQLACQNDVRCKAWTYVKPNTVQGPKPNCYLKSPAPKPGHNTCCVSGVEHQ